MIIELLVLVWRGALERKALQQLIANAVVKQHYYFYETEQWLFDSCFHG